MFGTSPKSVEWRSSKERKLKGITGVSRRLNICVIVSWDTLRRGKNTYIKLKPGERLHVVKLYTHLIHGVRRIKKKQLVRMLGMVIIRDEGPFNGAVCSVRFLEYERRSAALLVLERMGVRERGEELQSYEQIVG